MTRSFCPKCEFLIQKCICSFVTSINNETSVIVIRYPKEKNHALNTVNIARLVFSNFYLFDCEEIDQNELFLKTINLFKNPILVFPNENATELDNLNSNDVDALIFIDGTWDKAKKIYFKSKILQNLPSIKLKLENPSLYTLRKANVKNSFSTIEAITFTLKYFDKKIDTDRALRPFLEMIKIQKELMIKNKKE